MKKFYDFVTWNVDMFAVLHLHQHLEEVLLTDSAPDEHQIKNAVVRPAFRRQHRVRPEIREVDQVDGDVLALLEHPIV